MCSVNHVLSTITINCFDNFLIIGIISKSNINPFGFVHDSMNKILNSLWHGPLNNSSIDFGFVTSIAYDLEISMWFILTISLNNSNVSQYNSLPHIKLQF